jgi:peptide/nickel transport system substrate-binding protein
MIKKISWLLVISIIITSCGNNKKHTTEFDNKTVFTGIGGKKYIHNEDAEWNQSWRKDNVVIVHFAGEPISLHPSNASDEPRFIINNYTQKFLVRWGLENYDVEPDLVTNMGIISNDKLQYTYQLRSEAKWDDGSAITAKDVLFTLKVLKCSLTNNPQSKSALDNLKDVQMDAKNPLQFTFVFYQEHIQNADFMADYPILQQSFFDKNKVMDKYTYVQLSDTNFKAESQKDLADFEKEFNDSKYGNDVQLLTGAGPYKVSEWNKAQSITLIKKQNYWAANSNLIYDKALPEKIIFKINTDANSTMLEFKKQEIDVSSSLSTAKLLELRTDSNFNKNYYSYFLSTPNYTYASFNTKPDGKKHKLIFTDKNVRRAFALLTPADDIIKIVFKGAPSRITSVVSPMKKAYDSTLKLLSLDIAQATKLLDDASWKDSNKDGIRDKKINGEKVELIVDINLMNNMPEWKDVAMLMAESFAKVGAKLNLNVVDFSVWKEKARAHDFDMLLGVWGGYSGPDDFSQLWKTEGWQKHGDNYSGFGDETTDKLIDSIKFTIDESKRNNLTKRFERIVYDEQPYIFLFANTRRVVIHKRFGNADMYLQRPNFALNNLRILAK